jgi:hypothetical protein
MPQAPPYPSTRASESLALFDEFTSALSDPEAGEVLYRLHAADALVRRADSIHPAADVDPVAFGRAHRELSLRGHEVLPKFGRATVLQAPPHTGAPESVVWFEVAESRLRRTLIAALGVRTEQNVQRIGWCTLANRVEPWSYREGLLQSIGDYPWMLTSKPAMARALLDASYFRRHWRPPVMFHTLPDARFSCRMSTACCKHDFEIPLPPEAQLLIDAMPWQKLGVQLSDTRLPVRSDGKLQLKAVNETCRFLGAHRQCLIHQTLGRQPFGPCAVFPFAFAQTPQGIAVGLSPVCGSVRLGLGVRPHDREDDLRELLVHAEPRRANGFRLTPATEIPWENFRDIEKGLCDCLASHELPMRRRLYVGTRLLGALSRNEALDTNRWLSEPLPEISDELREAIRGMLSKVLLWDRAALRTLPHELPSELFNREVQDAPIVARILQNTLFSKVYSYPFDMVTAHNFSIVLYLLTLVMQAASTGPLTDAMWQELGSLGVHGLLKNVLHEGVPEGFRNLFGTADFGQWLLAA